MAPSLVLLETGLAALAPVAAPLELVHILLPRHAMLLAEGLPAETLLLGPGAEERRPDAARAAARAGAQAGAAIPARPLLTRAAALRRHAAGAGGARTGEAAAIRPPGMTAPPWRERVAAGDKGAAAPARRPAAAGAEAAAAPGPA